MEYWLLAAIGILICIIAALLIKIHLMRKTAGEIKAALKLRLYTDTNTLISISSRDSAMRSLAASLNDSLRMLRAKRHKYEHGDLELKDAVTNISHDLRTPLTAICGYLELLSDEEKSDTAARYIAQIENRTLALKNLTEELFRYSVIASVDETSKTNVDLRCLLEESLISFYGAMQKQHITPVISLPDTPVPRQLDAAALSRIFGNIISNALKYSDGDFSVTMKSDGTILFSNSAKQLDAVSVGRMFERFYTVESGRKSTGLGLSIAKLLTERMGGHIGAAFTEGRLTITVAFKAGKA